MASQASKVTRKGQVTIPAEFRDEFGIHEGDYVVFRRLDGNLVVERESDIVKRTAGALKHYRKATPVDPADEKAAVGEAIAEEYAAWLRDR